MQRRIIYRRRNCYHQLIKHKHWLV